MKIKYKYFDNKTKELNDKDIIDGLESALQDYKDGAILECRDTLNAISKAITRFEECEFSGE